MLRPKKGSAPIQASYRDALIAWVLTTRVVNFTEYERLVFEENDWWVKKNSIRALNGHIFGPENYTSIINKLIRAAEGEVAIVAASRLLEDGLSLTKPYGDASESAKRTLKAAGVIRSTGQPKSRINEVLGYVLGRPKTTYAWKAFFGNEHKHAERMAIWLKRNRESNIEAFLIQMDSYCDLLTEELFRRSVPLKSYPAYGAAIVNPTLNSWLPKAMAAFQKLHQIRLDSTVSHPRTKVSGKPTRRLNHRDFHNIRPELIVAFDELESVVIP